MIHLHFNDSKSTILQSKIETSRWLLLQCEKSWSTYFVLLNLLNTSLVKFTFKNIGEHTFKGFTKWAVMCLKVHYMTKDIWNILEFGICGIWSLILVCSLQAFSTWADNSGSEGRLNISNALEESCWGTFQWEEGA